MNQYDHEWKGPKAEYKSLEGALGAAVRTSDATDPPLYAYVIRERRAYRVTQELAVYEAAYLAGNAVARVMSSRKAKSNSTPPPSGGVASTAEQTA